MRAREAFPKVIHSSVCIKSQGKTKIEHNQIQIGLHRDWQQMTRVD